MASPPTVQARPTTGRAYLLLGIALAVLGVMAYVAQVALLRLQTPWYMPIAATLGVILVAYSLWHKRTVWRMLGLVTVLLLCGLTWIFLLGLRLPPYRGPLAVGQPVPAFATQRAEGSPFTQADLAGDQNTVLVLFRGRW